MHILCVNFEIARFPMLLLKQMIFIKLTEVTQFSMKLHKNIVKKLSSYMFTCINDYWPVGLLKFLLLLPAWKGGIT